MKRLAAALVLLAALPAGARAQQTPSDRLRTLFDEEWQRALRESPLMATSFGDLRYNAMLPEVGLAAQQSQMASNREALRRLLAIPRDSLSPADRLNYDVFRRVTEDEIGYAEYRGYLIPITNREGFHTFFPELPSRVPLSSVREYEDYIARLTAFRRYAGEHIELMREGIRQGMVLPRISVDSIGSALRPHIVEDPTASLLYRPFTAFPAAVPDSARARLERAGRQAILEAVSAGYRDFLQFMEREYIPAARTSIAASELPQGRAYYRQRVRAYTTLELTPEEVHRTGLAEMERIRAAMDSVMRTTGFQGDFPAFVQHLRTDSSFYLPTPERLLERTSLVLKRMDGQLPRLFGRLPRQPYGIREIPAFIAPRTTTAYYSQGSPDGTRAGTYFVNTHDLRSRPTYEIESLSLHEAVPGHHLQIALAQELTDVPNFRRTTGFTAFVEGWALYAESLGGEAGFYTDPYSYFGHLTYDAWRACRLVVDTGIHEFGWTRQQAIDYMAANTGLSMRNIENEVDRYIAWPGQALAYKTGQLRIRGLRTEAERTLGGRFDLRAFHDVVLGSGAVPLGVLEDNVHHWISERASR